MIEITTRAEASAQPGVWLELPFDLRQRSRLRAELTTGEDAWLMLPRGEILRGGDILRATDGRVVGVIARPEQLLHVTCETPQALARVAYHLGNRHVPVEVGEGYLRLALDHVLENMVRGLGANASVIREAFEPEAGAYAGHTHSDADTRPGRIHEYGRSFQQR